MLKKKHQQILKNILKNNLILKYEYINIIIKSIIHNENIKYKTRFFASINNKKKTIKKKNKICLLSGRHRGIYNKLSMSRHNTNYFSKIGILQNYKINSW